MQDNRIQPITNISKAISPYHINDEILRQFDMDMQVLYNKIITLESRVKELEEQS